MRSFFKSVIFWAAVICVLPAAAAGGIREDKPESVQASQSIILPDEKKIKLLCTSTGQITEMDIEDYAVYAVLEEVPFIPDAEALKAQVCAARTYAARRIISGETEKGAHISDDGSRFQTALSESDARAVYGSDYDEALAAVKAAAMATEGEIIMYGEAPAAAVFHLSSAGVTESAENVWGKAYPYLVSVPSDCTEARREFTKAELAARISSEYEEAAGFDGIEILSSTDAGTVLSARLCGIELSGRRLSELLSLDSAAFEVCEKGDAVVFTVKGSGHLVGMSICGADELSRRGMGYREILEHYYPGTYIEKMQ
ncbi:MAG: SpoIID/LytB domain-containing protein [Huintestinicola sp.]|uniref:SpoIID/LytB domain-containing protein n=1 Tax=Huintestinicola sp. TaxID=2981661 RepID=UPI003F07AD79